MQLTRIADATAYQAPGHFGMAALRLQGHDRSDSQAFWVGLSHFLPAGGAERSASALERVYVVLDGAVTLTTDDGEVVLNPLDSVHLAGGESRALVNHTNRPASMLVVMPYQAPAEAAGR